MAMVDTLAEMLSRKTGTTFMVMRARLPLENPRTSKDRRTRMDGKPRTVVRYGLRAMRHDVSYRFQGTRALTLRELTAWLATINDMVNMNFIPVDPYKKGTDR